MRLHELRKFLPRRVVGRRPLQQHPPREVVHHDLALLLGREVHEFRRRFGRQQSSGAFADQRPVSLRDCGVVVTRVVDGDVGTRAVVAVVVGRVAHGDLAEQGVADVHRAHVLVLPHMGHLVHECETLQRPVVGVEIDEVAGDEGA